MELKKNDDLQEKNTYQMFPIEEKEDEEDFKPYFSKKNGKQAPNSEAHHGRRIRTQSLDSRDSSFISRSSLHRPPAKRASLMIIAFPTTMVAIPQFPLLQSKEDKRQVKQISFKDQLFKIEKEAYLQAKRKARLFRHLDSQILSPKIKISNVRKIGSSNIFLGKDTITQDSKFEPNLLKLPFIKKLISIERKQSSPQIWESVSSNNKTLATSK